MEFFFSEDNLDNNVRATPEETKIASLSAQPYPDGRRVRVNLEVTPFQTRPHVEVILVDANGDEVASTSLVEPMSWKLEFTMHVRGGIQNPYTLHARLYYPDGPAAEPVSCAFEIPPALEEDADDSHPKLDSN